MPLDTRRRDELSSSVVWVLYKVVKHLCGIGNCLPTKANLLSSLSACARASDLSVCMFVSAAHFNIIMYSGFVTKMLT